MMVTSPKHTHIQYTKQTNWQKNELCNDSVTVQISNGCNKELKHFCIQHHSKT